MVSIAATAPFAQTILSPREQVDEGDPLNPYSFTLSGSTLYGVSPSDCFGEDSVGESSYAAVVAIDTATGEKTYPTEFGCNDPGPVAAAPDGSLLIVFSGRGPNPATIVRIAPSGGRTHHVRQGRLAARPGGPRRDAVG